MINLKAKSYKLKATQGFTLVETLIAISIIALVAVLVVIPFASFRDEKLLDGAAEDILSFLHEAQTRTLSSDGATPYGVYFESGKIVLFKGAAFLVGDPNNKEVLLHNRLTISNITLTGGSSAVFKRLTGATDNNGMVTINLVADNSRQRVITISAAGNAGLK